MSEKSNLLKWSTSETRAIEEKSGYYAAFLFLVWPLLAVVSAFQNYNKSWAKNILWAFVAFFGFTYAIGAESQGSDIVGYVAQVKDMHQVKMTLEGALNYYLQSGEIDILRTFIAIVVSRFTESQAVLTLVYGAIFGFFFSRNIWFVLDRLKGKIRPITMLLMVCFFLVVPMWNITTFRMWTAAHIFTYGLLPFLFEGQKRGVAIATLSILVHYAFLVPVGVLFAYLLLGNRLTIYFVFFITTFFIAEVNLETFNNFVENYAPEIVQERTAGYRGEHYVESYREGGVSKVWYARWHGRALKWSVMGFMVFLFLRGRNFFKKNKYWARLLSFVLLFYGIANLLSSLPSGGRYVSIANLAALALIIMYVQNREEERGMRQLTYLATPALLLFVVVAVRMGLYSLSPTTILGNPVIAIFLAGDYISLNDALKMFI